MEIFANDGSYAISPNETASSFSHTFTDAVHYDYLTFKSM
jgi:hypothetical protein